MMTPIDFNVIFLIYVKWLLWLYLQHVMLSHDKYENKKKIQAINFYTKWLILPCSMCHLALNVHCAHSCKAVNATVQ